MGEQRRYRVRSSAVGLTRGQLIVSVLAAVAAVVGFGVSTVSFFGGDLNPVGGILIGAAGMTFGIVTLLAHATAKPPNQ